MGLVRLITATVIISALATGCLQGDKGTGPSKENAPPSTLPVPHGCADTNGGNAEPNGTSFPTDRPYSEWVTPNNQHQVLSAVANEQIGPGNLFSASTEALEGFRGRVAGEKGWTFLPLSKDNFAEYRVYLRGKPRGFLLIEGHRLQAAQYQIFQTKWWDERTKVEWPRIRWDNLPHVLSSAVCGEVPNAEQLFSNSQAHAKFKALFPDRSWEFRTQSFKGGIDETVVDVVHDGKVTGTLTLFIGQQGIEEVDYHPQRQ